MFGKKCRRECHGILFGNFINELESFDSTSYCSRRWLRLFYKINKQIVFAFFILLDKVHVRTMGPIFTGITLLAQKSLANRTMNIEIKWNDIFKITRRTAFNEHSMKKIFSSRTFYPEQQLKHLYKHLFSFEECIVLVGIVAFFSFAHMHKLAHDTSVPFGHSFVFLFSPLFFLFFKFILLFSFLFRRCRTSHLHTFISLYSRGVTI